MDTDTKPTKREKLSRKERRTRRYKHVLRCEWCNRWTEVAAKRWQRLKSEDKLFPSDYLFFCMRDRCRFQRLDYLPPEE